MRISYSSSGQGTVVCILAVLLLCYSSATAQSNSPATTIKIKPGDLNANGLFLKPYKNVWKIVYTFPGKEPLLIGTWSDELSEVELNGRHLLKRRQVANYAKYNIITENINL